MMKMVTTTPNELKQQIGEAIAKAMETYREDYPNKKANFSRNRVLTMETMIQLYFLCRVAV